MPNFYIQRKLHGRDGPILDCELVGQSGVFVVLAEPGAGKTELLDFLSKGYGVAREPGNQFVHRSVSSATVLVIDALDEVARIGEEMINEIIVKARASGATTIIFASRSYFWDEARTAAARVCFGIEPTILRLEPFDDGEQRQLFAYHRPTEDFTAFKSEVERFELEPILGNPQFLQLFADAYVEGGRKFSSKKQIYADAVRRLASESRAAAGVTGRPAISEIIAVAHEIYAKLLLSGASGISTNEDIDEGAYPYLHGFTSSTTIADFALNTRLFKPTGSVNRHDPIHRIVAEYGAADFLVKRIEAPGNTLSLRRCLSVIAPNSVVRSELRGLVGWMASLGNRVTQETIVDLDPYAVFANGDASQLHPSVKPRLLRRLQSLAEIDPFFRRMDSWRRFNVAGFFSADTIEHVRPFLSLAHSQSHLLGLMMELLHGTEAAKGLEREFRAIMLNTEAEDSDRQRAYQNIVAISSNGALNDFDALVVEATRDSLDIASQMLAKDGVSRFGRGRTLTFIKALAALYPEERVRAIGLGPTYFARRTFSDFLIDDIRFLLDEITADLACTCGKPKPYACTCRRGKSKVAGLLLDRYFESMIGPRDPRQIRQWTERLIFKEYKSAEHSASVAEMSQAHGLRRAIQISRVGYLRDPEKIRHGMADLFMSSTHSGLQFRDGDHDALVDHALNFGNHALWGHLVIPHNPYDTSRQRANPSRARMRAQSRTSPALQRIWAKVNRDYAMSLRRDHVRIGHSRRTIERRDAEQKAKFLAHFSENRHLIEAGRHGGWLTELARRYLHGTHADDPIIEDEKFIETALRNCFDFLSAQVPSLKDLSEGRGGAIPMILEAACLATFRHSGSINAVHPDVLRVVRAGNPGGSGYKGEEASRLIANIDGILFPSDAEKIEFATRLVEPQLAAEEDAATKVHLIDHGETFESVKGTLAIDWLTRHPKMPWNARNTLFNIAVTHSDATQLRALIDARCKDPIIDTEHGIRRRSFWLLRHFFFILPTSATLWAEFSSEPKAILQIEHYAGRLSRHDAVGWPQLNAEQVYRILDTFVSVWPKIHLPSSWGSGDPPEETAYRFLSEIIFSAGRDAPSNSIPVFDQLLADDRFTELHSSIKSLRAEAARQRALAGFSPPCPSNISALFNNNGIASVEDMRALLVEMLDALQKELKGGATNRADVFYSGSRRVNENTGRNRVVEALQDRFHSLNLGVTVEHQMIDETRCDFTVSTVIDGSKIILATEMKGQWNPGLFTAAAEQLTARYSIFPGAADQGVYLILWFGSDVTIAGRKEPSLSTPELLRQEILKRMPVELAGRIDVYILDVSRSRKAKRRPKASKAKTQRKPSSRTTRTAAKPKAKPAKRASVRSGKPKRTTSKAARSIPNAKGAAPRPKAKRVKKAPSKAAKKLGATKKPARAIAKVVPSKSKAGQRKKASAKTTKKVGGAQAVARTKSGSRKTPNGASKSPKRPARKRSKKGRE